jgi:glyoxylase-like metal-dependent hydrolase (beta-lactamase superfamily II)
LAYFRQIASETTDRFSYLLADMDKRQAVVIDPADDQGVLYLSLLAEIRVRLVRILLTHGHAAGIIGVDRLRAATRAPLSAAVTTGLERIDQPLDDGDLVAFGDEVIHVRFTPGHSRGCTCYLWRDRVFTGETLLIDDCGATDSADGDPGILFDSLAQRLLVLPDETLIYPGRNLKGRQVSCIGEQRHRNPRLAGITRDEFIAAQAQRRKLAAERSRTSSLGEPSHDHP